MDTSHTPGPGRQHSLIYFGDQWDDLWRRRQALCHSLASKSLFDRALYVEQPLSLSSLLWWLRHPPDADAQRRWSRLLRQRRTMLQVHPKICLWTPVTPLGLRQSPILSAVDNLFRVHGQARTLRRLTSRMGFSLPIVCVSLPLVDKRVLESVQPALLWYDCTEDFTKFEHLPARVREACGTMDAWLTDNADVVTAVSVVQFEAKRARRGSRATLYSPNGLLLEPFLAPVPSDEPEDLAAIPRPRLTFVGAGLNTYLDWDLIDMLASRRPDLSLVLIGQDTLPRHLHERLAGHHNIHFLGLKPYGDLPRYLAHADLCLQISRPGHLPSQESVLKVWLYLAAGKPVLSLTATAGADKGGLIAVAATRDEFIAKVDEAMASDTPRLQERRKALAQESSWDARADTVCRALEEALVRKGLSG
ncbi:MAG: glycosyltransferase [Dehalococcoidia bacterium]|nr:glycosyltransferase [Dehalococcoidia bacterium]